MVIAALFLASYTGQGLEAYNVYLLTVMSAILHKRNKHYGLLLIFIKKKKDKCDKYNISLS